MRNSCRARGDRGFTLVELLVVLIIFGVLAAVAVPVLLTQRRKAVETSAASDARVIAGEVLSHYVVGDGALVLDDGSTVGTWELRSAVATVAQGRLSKGNRIGASSIVSDRDYCVAVEPVLGGSATWVADQNGLRRGSC